jgi:hypothetical protein
MRHRVFLWRWQYTERNKPDKNGGFSILVKKTRGISALHCNQWWLQLFALW